MFKKKIFIGVTIILVFLLIVLFKLDYKISQSDKHADWPELASEGVEIDSIKCITKGNLIIKAISVYYEDKGTYDKKWKIDSVDIEKYNKNIEDKGMPKLQHWKLSCMDSILRVLTFDNSRILILKKNEKEGIEFAPKKEYPNLEILDSIIYGNKFSWGTTFTGFGLSGTGGTTSGKHYSSPISFLHEEKFYIKIKIGIDEGLFKITEDYAKNKKIWFYQLNFPNKESDTLYFYYRNTLIDSYPTLFYAYKTSSTIEQIH